MSAEDENSTDFLGLLKQLGQRVWDWVLDRGETTLSIAIAFMAFLVLATSAFPVIRLILAVIVFVLSVAQYVLKDKSKQRIDELRGQLEGLEEEKGQWKEREDEYQEQIRKLHEGNKAALNSWIVTVFETCKLDHCHRLSLFILSQDKSVAYLLTRYSADPTITGVGRPDYNVEGAVGLAWKQRKHVGELMIDPGTTKKSRRKYASAAAKKYDVDKAQVEESEMCPRHYASWRLDITDEPAPTIVVFESKIDSLAKVDTLENHILGEESKAMRHLADLVREYEIQSRDESGVDIEEGAS